MRSYITLSLTGLVVFFLLQGCSGKAKFIERDFSVTAYYSENEPVIDGIVNEPCWKKANTISLTSISEEQDVKPTVVRTAWRDSTVFIAFECHDRDAATTAKNRDGEIEKSDHVTLLLDPDMNPATVALFRIAPNGVFSDTFCLIDTSNGSIKELHDWNCDGVRVASTVYGGSAQEGDGDRFWTVEIAIPVSQLYTNIGPPSGDNPWLCGFARADYVNDTMERSYFAVDSNSYRQPCALLKFER